MSSIRDLIIKDFVNDLDRPLFTRHGFTCSFNREDGYIVLIVFKENPKFKFTIKDKNYSGYWITEEAPGINFLDGESYQFNEFDKAKGRLRFWVQRIIEEITIDEKKTKTMLETWRKDLTSFSDGMTEPDKPFDEKESQQWVERLDDLVVKFSDLSENDELQKQELDSLKKEVESLKANLSKLPKSTWMKAAGNKIINIMENLTTKAGEAIAEGVVKGLICGGN
jgi:hypothetical protein